MQAEVEAPPEDVAAEPLLAAPVPILQAVEGQRVYSFTYAICGTELKGPVSQYPNKTYVEITNMPEEMPGPKGMALHTYRACMNEKDTLFARHAGENYSSTARVRRIPSGPMPYLCLTTFNGNVGDFLASLPPPSFRGERCTVTPSMWQAAVMQFPFPEQSVAWHLARGYQGLFGQSFASFSPMPFRMMRDPSVRPDLVYHCYSYLCTLVGTTHHKALYFINYFAVDVRVPWASYETDTGLPRHVMVAGEWWMRMKVCRTTPGGSRVSSSLAARHPPE